MCWSNKGSVICLINVSSTDRAKGPPTPTFGALFVLIATYDGGATNAKLFDKSRIKQNDSNRFVVMIVVGDCTEHLFGSIIYTSRGQRSQRSSDEVIDVSEGLPYYSMVWYCAVCQEWPSPPSVSEGGGEGKGEVIGGISLKMFILDI